MREKKKSSNFNINNGEAGKK
jgi:hypothetical protein